MGPPPSKEKGSAVAQTRFPKPNAVAPCERRANIRKTPRVPARDSRLQSRHRKAPVAGCSKKPSNGLEPSTPSLPWMFSGEQWQLLANVLASQGGFRRRWRDGPLLSVATAGLHKGSIVSASCFTRKLDGLTTDE